MDEVFAQKSTPFKELKFPYAGLLEEECFISRDVFYSNLKKELLGRDDWFFLRNFIGRDFLLAHYSSGKIEYRGRNRAIASQSLQNVEIALSLYRIDKGALPKTLNELVPSYLDKVPTDPFDGGELRYDVERKLVYSVGRNCADDGGDGESFPANDIIFQFEK